MTLKHNTDKKWQEEFYKKFVNHGEFIYNKGGYPAMCGEITDFISSLLLQSRKEWIEKIKGKIKTVSFEKDGAGALITEVYNQAITDICSLLEESGDKE